MKTDIRYNFVNSTKNCMRQQATAVIALLARIIIVIGRKRGELKCSVSSPGKFPYTI